MPILIDFGEIQIWSEVTEEGIQYYLNGPLNAALAK